jgi:hypothetical protein
MRRNFASSLLSIFLVAASIGYFWVRGERFIAANGLTFDEGLHLTAGFSYWTSGNFALNAEHPPLLKLLWALPLVLGNASAHPVERAGNTENQWKIADEWMYGSGVSHRSSLDPARRVNLAIGCGVVLLAGWWAYRVWGSKLAALATIGFASSDPTLLALSCILSTDVGLTFFGLLTCYLMWEYVQKPSRSLLFGAGVSLGLMLAAKFSAVGIVAGLGMTGLVHLRRGGTLSLPGKETQCGTWLAIEFAIRLGVIAIATTAATYAFINFDQWGKGLKFQLTRGGHGDGVMYLDGEISRKGWYHYFIVALLAKLPLGLLIAAAISILRLSILSLKRARSASEGQTSHPSFLARNYYANLWLIIPPLVFFAMASYSRVDMGIRVVLSAIPFLYLLASGLANVQYYRMFVLTLLGGCLAWCFVAAECANSRELSYFNEIGGKHSAGRHVLADSNLDWGQGLPALKKWMDQESVDRVYLSYFGTDRPESYGIHFRQLPGYGRIGPASSDAIPENAGRHIVAVSANHLYGLFLNDPNLYSWLRERKPISTLDGSIHVFDLTDDPEALARIRALSPQ